MPRGWCGGIPLSLSGFSAQYWGVMSEPSSLERLPPLWWGRRLVARLGWAGVVSCVLVGVMGAMTTWLLERGHKI